MGDVLSYYSSTVISTSGDKTAKYLPGQLLRITQDGGLKFFIIISVTYTAPTTYITVNGGGIYTLTSSAITLPYKTANLAASGQPYGFPYSYLQRTLTGITGTVRGRRAEFTLAPASTPSSLSAYGDYVTIENAVGDVNTYSTIVGGGYTAKLQVGAAATSLDGLLAAALSYGSCAAIKGMWATAYNFSRNAGFNYAMEAAADNWSQSDAGTGIANTDLIRAIRARIRNVCLNSYGTGALGPANATVANAFYSNIINQKYGTDNGNYDATIGTASQLECDVNNILGTITNNYYIKLNAPVNSGTITNHWGIYLADQTVVGSTINYAIYVAGGNVYFGSDLYVVGDVNCGSLTDHTDAYAGDALTAVGKIKADEKGKIDHSTLPEFARSKYKDSDGAEQDGRNIGNMVTILTKAVQQLTERLEAAEAEITRLKGTGGGKAGIW